MKPWPVVKVMRSGRGVNVESVEWISEDGDAVDLTEMKVLRIETDIIPGELPRVKVTFIARLVELEKT